MKKDQKQFNLRLRIVFGILSTVGFVLLANLFYIQVRLGEQFRSQADNQYVVATHNSFERGSIIFESKDGGQITVAGQKKGYKISINPSRIDEEQRKSIFAIMESVIPFSYDEFMKRTSSSTRTYLEIAHRIPKQEAEEFKKELGRSISLHTEKWRTYPLGRSAAHIIGFLGYDNNNIFGGRYGLENFYNETLQRKNTDLYTNFFARVFHGVQNLVDSEYEPEGDIVSSIDPKVQLFFEQQLEGIQSTWSSAATGGLIMSPKTGEIYAMGAYPNFDNNNFSEESLGVFRNPLVANVYEFGSIMKPLVVSMGIDAGLINAGTEYYDKGFVQVERHTIYNFDKKGRGWVNVQEILNQSLNTGMVFITEKISKKTFREYFKKYGFGEKSGIDLPGDGTGLTSNLKSNRDIEFANISFGQGIAISPVSFVHALSALANNGKTVTPHVIKRIEYNNGVSKNIDYSQNQIQVINPETAGEISRILVNVFDEYRNGDVKFDNHRIAAKTGTAQIPDPTGGYYDDRNLHSFFGYFPAYEPEFIVFIYTVHPKNVKYSSQTLIDPFVRMTNYLINYYNIPPDR